ncbi:MAG TPA: KGG domain-containing protein [Candidatus Paceibacterota bacterium]|nr:KGG domain-containing protein [Candidatus Paceibacterota bacterium]
MSTQQRGLGSENMDPQKKREIQSMGGQASSASRVQDDSEEQSGRGRGSGGNFANDPERARREGSKGGQASARRRQEKSMEDSDQEGYEEDDFSSRD